MKIFLCECKKMMSFRIFWIIFVCLFAINGYVQIDRINVRYYTPESYRSFFSETKDMSLEEIQDYTNEMLERQNNGEYIEFPMMLVYDMSELSKECENYPEYLNSIKEQTNNMSAVSIWGDSDTFSYRNIQKTPSAYENLPAEPLPLAASFGLENTFTSPITDFMGIFLVFLAVCGIILKDREHGITFLLSSMPKGRSSLILSKLFAVSLFASFVAVMLFAENLVIGGALYGIGELQRPIQSVFGFYQCNLAVSVGEFLLLFFILKIASYLLFAMIFSLICTVSRNNLMIYGISGAVCTIAFLCYRLIPQNSVFQLFHDWNPIKFTQTAEILGTYQNVNLFGYPVSLKISMIIIIVITIVSVILCCIFAVEKLNHVQYQSVRLKVFHKKKIKAHGRFFYVCYRSLILNKGVILVLTALFAAAVFSASFSRQYSNDDIYYENFTTELSGEITTETLNFFTEKEKQYNEIEKEIEKIQSSENINTYQLNLLSDELNDRVAFERLKLRVKSIQENECNGKIFYDTGYERLFQYAGGNEKMFFILFMMIFSVLILSPIGAADKKTDMVKVIFSTKSGKTGYYRDLFLYGILCGIFSATLFFFPYIFNILKKYGTQGLSAPIQSIQQFSNLDISISVCGFILFFLFIHIIGSIICSVSIAGISSLCKSRTSAYIINTALFVLPVILILLKSRLAYGV